jgi:NAD(P)-dependent dehydrogenase (short-subunit alcohol dehydrogenase family)
VDLGLEGKGAFVVGATGAIGGAVADALAEEGVRVACGARSHAGLQPLRDRLGQACVGTVEMDLRDAASVATAVDTVEALLGGVDILVCAAAGDVFAPIWEVTREQWEDELLTKYLGTADLCRTMASRMIHRRSGVILAMTGIAAQKVFTTNPMNGAANVALENTLRLLAVASAPAGVRVVGISPGMTQSRRFASFAESRLADIAASIPVGRIADGRDLADLAIFLASPRASYVTATTVVADGGLSAWDARLPLPGNEHVEGRDHDN